MTHEYEKRISKFMDWLFYAALAFSASKVVGSVDRVQESISELNVKVGVVVEKTSKHETQIQAQDERLRYLERSQNKHK